MAWLGIRQLQRDQYRREAEYWQHECAMLEYENRFLHGLEQRLIPRLLNRFGADMQDFMIDRELVRHNETAHPKQAGHITVQMYRYYAAVAQKFNRLKTLKSLLKF